ncbi:MAG: hypothetical protein J4428_04395 [Candidatus Aenigmarchaeota archaeon]|nr:hypothetical protein [Candidatus Aenigmarchaeota archaeon]
MKGLALEHIFGIFLLAVLVIISTGIMFSFFKQSKNNEFTPVENATYLCHFLNNNEISFEDFKSVLYGFINNQCFEFKAKLKEKITFDDIRNFVETIDTKKNVVKTNECPSSGINTDTIYIGFDFIDNEYISLFSKQVLYNDVLICKAI